MNFFILILSWIVLITANQESLSNDEGKFVSVAAPTLKPVDNSDVIYQPGLGHKSRPRISFQYEQRRFIDLPHVESKKENTQHFFRVRKPIERRKIFHISRQNDNLPQAEVVQGIGGPNTESKLRDLIKNDTTEDKRYDYILDKLPEAWAVTQDNIVPLYQKTNDEVDISTIPKTNAPTTELYQISSALPETISSEEIKSVIKNQEEIRESDAELKLDDPEFEKILLEKIKEGMDSMNSNARPQNSHLDIDSTTTISSTPWIEILLMSDDGLKWEMNGTVKNFPKLLVEEVTLDDYPITNITEDFPMMTTPESDLINYTIYSTARSTSTGELTEKTPTSSAVTMPSESSNEYRLGYSNTPLEDVILNIGTRRNDIYNVQGYTTVKLEALITPKLPTRRHRRRKYGRKTSTLSTDVFITDTTTTASTTVGYKPELSKLSSSHGRFTHRQGSHFRRRNRVSKPTESLTPGSENINNTATNISPFTQIRGKPTYRKWNRNRNITPTVMNPQVLSSNITSQRVDFSKVEAEISSTASPSPVELSTNKTKPPRMRFRNRMRKSTTTTPSTPSNSNVNTEGTTDLMEVNGNTAASNQSTEKIVKHPPPPPTLSPWYDGYGK